MNVIDFARALIDIDSTTGREADAGAWLATELSRLGYRVARQPVDAERFNVVATLDQPLVTLSTHFDCVPPFFPSRIEDNRLYGRGACDAKGILAAQVAAAELLRREGERRIALLFVVGEERGSDGAEAANAQPLPSRFFINGEPTDSRLATATRGVLRIKLTARGRAAHSAAPDHGESAIDKLLDALMLLRTIELPSDPLMGRTFYSIGLIDGGVAPNVISPHASAEVMFRTVGPAEKILEAIDPLRASVEVTEILRVTAVRLHAPAQAGIETAAFPFTTDIPLLDRWGTPLLFGPGSFLVAHTDREHVSLDELTGAVETCVRLVKFLLQ
jgi:acetylornithine deacetylase